MCVSAGSRIAVRDVSGSHLSRGGRVSLDFPRGSWVSSDLRLRSLLRQLNLGSLLPQPQIYVTSSFDLCRSNFSSPLRLSFLRIDVVDTADTDVGIIKTLQIRSCE